MRVRLAPLPPSHRVCAAGFALWVAMAATPSRAVAPPPVAGEELALSSDLRIRVRQGRVLELYVLPSPGEGYAGIAGRITGDSRLGPVLSDWNGQATRLIGGKSNRS